MIRMMEEEERSLRAEVLGALGGDERAAVLSEWNAACAAADAKLPPSQRASPSLCLSMVGMFLHLRGNYDEAMRCYDYALELEPKAIDVLLKRASLWFEKEQLAKAFEDFDTVEKATGDDRDLLWGEVDDPQFGGKSQAAFLGHDQQLGIG